MPLLNQLRTEVNKVLENARIGKLIGSSLEAKVYLHAANETTLSKLQEISQANNDADQLHRIFITSQVHLSMHHLMIPYCMIAL